MGGFAWVTLATNDSYSLGALVLAHSLRRVGTKHDLAVLVTPGVTGAMREKLSSIFSLVQEVNVLDSKDEANLALLARPELGITFTKLHCWRLTQYDKCVFLDADTLVIRNCDELFEREELSAAPDVGWPDCFNSGVFVYRPSQQTFASLTNYAAAKGSFDGGDQGLLNQYFSDWAHKDISKHLPFIYNMCSTATYSYLPAFKQFGDDVRIIHFIGTTKPWLQNFDTLTGQVQPSQGSNHLQPLLQVWWTIFCDNVHPQLSPQMAGIAGALAKITLGEVRSAEQIALEEHMRKHSWEQGEIDYMGRDSFDNIWKKISETLGVQPEREPSPPKVVPEKEKSEIKEATPSTAEVEAPAKSEAAVLSEPQQTGQDPIDEFAQEAKNLVPELTKGQIIDEAVPSSTIIDASVSKVALVPKLSPLESTPESTETKSTDDVSASFCGLAKPSEPEKLIKTEEISSSVILSGDILSETHVPIQVAESVLEAEVKESVTEDLRPVGEEAISSISSIAQESVPAVLETVMEAPRPIDPPLLNGSTSIGNGIDLPCFSSPTRITSATVAVVEAPLDVVASVQSLPTPSPLPQTSRETKDNLQKEASESVPEFQEAKPSTQQSSAPIKPEDPVLAVAFAKSEEPSIESIQSSSLPLQAIDKPEPKSQESTITIGSTTKTEASSASIVAADKPRDTKTHPEVSQVSKILAECAESSSPKSEESKVPTDTTPLKMAEHPPGSSIKMPMSSKPLRKIEIPAMGFEKQVSKDSSTSFEETEETASQSESSEESPLRPTRTKDLQIPSTPTITAATPPTSPPIDGAERETEQKAPKVTKKIVKKVVKKTTSATTEGKSAEPGEADAEVKKVTKKIVKKVVKKKEDEGNTEGASGTEKPKKTVKVVKKTTKSSTSLETDATVPETPPPGSADVPVPPKRKLKTTKTTVQKTDSEQL